MTRVLIAGAGMAAVECALALRAMAGASIDVELLAPAAELVHRPSSVETPFGGEPARRIDLDGLARELGVRLHRDALASVEAGRHRILTRDGDCVPYEILVVATGARSREAVPGATTFRGPMSAGAVEQAVDRVEADPRLRLAFVAPGGVRWPLPLYELGLLAATALRERGVPDPDVVVATPEHAPLEALGAAVGEAVRASLDRAGVDLVTSATAVAACGAVGLPEPFRPIVRAQLLTGDAPLYIRAELGEGDGVASTEPLWSPPGKVGGRYLAAYLAGGHAGAPLEDLV